MISRHRIVQLCTTFLFLFALFACSESSAVDEEVAKSSNAGSSKTDSSKTGPRVSVVTTETRRVEQSRTWYATLHPLDHHVVKAIAAGIVTRYRHSVGDALEKDELVITLDIPGVRERHAVLKERRQNLQTEVERWERLRSREAAGIAEVDAARIRLLEVDETIAELEGLLKGQRINAPGAGFIAASHIHEGAHVVAGQDLLTITLRESMGLRLTVSSADVGYFKDLDGLEIRRRGSASTGASPAVKVRRIIFQEAPEAGYVGVEIRVEGLDDLSPGDVEIISRHSREALIAPWTAIAVDDDKPWVALVDGETEQIERRPVVLGDAFSDGIEIVEGLGHGDTILRHQPRDQPEGRRVQPVERP